MSKENELGSLKISSLLFKLAVPTILAQIINALYNVVDRMYIGRIEGFGASPLTGVGVCFPLIMLISAFTYLIGIGGAPLAAISMGKGDNKYAEKIMGNCTFSLILCSVILMIIYFIFGEQLLYLFGASEKTIDFAKSYMGIYIFGTLFVQISLGLNAFITTQGFSKVSMKTVIIGAVINIILDPILIFGFHMGVKGAAIATVISQMISAVWVFWFLCGKRTILKIRLKNFKIEPAVILSAMALGVSPFIMQSTESLLSLCFNSSLLKYGGDIAVGAMTILSSVMQFTMMPLQGITQGAQPIVSYNYGAEKIDRVKKAFFLTFNTCIIYSGIVWLVIMICPSVVVGIFTTDKELVDYTCRVIRVYCAMLLLMGAQTACQQTFIALSNAKTSAFLALLRKVILLIPLIFILPCFISNDVFAVFLAEPIADTIAVAVTVTMFFISFNKIINKDDKVIKEQVNNDTGY